MSKAGSAGEERIKKKMRRGMRKEGMKEKKLLRM